MLEFGVLFSLVVGLILSVEVGYRLGRRSRGSKTATTVESGAVQGAMLGLLGLLLGFSFAGASGRFMERQDLITAEANAISTAYLRADLLDEASAPHLRDALLRYVDDRIEVSKLLKRGFSKEEAQRVAQLHQQIWDAAMMGVTISPQYSVVVLSSVNEVIDLHALRLAASRKHLPRLVVGLLLMCSALTLAVIGYASARTEGRNSGLTTTIAILIAASLWTTIDMDHPRVGLIHLNDAALTELQLHARASEPVRPKE